jgi:large subunit ribosomal protein L6
MMVVKGKNGELSTPLHGDIELSLADNVVTLKLARDTRQARALWGTMRANLSNMVVGVSAGFTRKLEINGVGYRAAMQGNKLVLSLGYSHPVEMDVPAGLKVNIENNTSVTITGADKQLLGQFAAEVRAKRPPEPYKGKGVKYADEYIVRKEGKKK